MKRIFMNIIFTLISLIIPFNVYALSTTNAKEEIDLNKNINLTLNYYYDDYNLEGADVKFYYIASVTDNFIYQLSSDFVDYPIKINGITTESEWNILDQTINSYIEADNINETLLYTIENNIITISNLKSGLYFVKTEKIDTEDYTLLFDSFLLNIPDLNEDGTWNYDVNVYPKVEKYTPKYEEINYTVVKEWNDISENRPKSVEIEIYKDGILVENQVLSSWNNWSYQWKTLDDGNEWTVVERNIPNGYNVSILKNNNNFIIINTDSNYEDNNPQTSDNIKLYFYLLFTSIIGFILLIISLITKKRN